MQNLSHLSPTEAASVELGIPSAEVSLQALARPSSLGWKLSTGVQMAHCHGGDCGGGAQLCLPLPCLGEAGRRGAAWPPAHRLVPPAAWSPVHPHATNRASPALPQAGCVPASSSTR